MTNTTEDGFNPWGSGPDPIEPRDLDWHQRALYDLTPPASASNSDRQRRAAESP
jgi:hypothetical protein